MKTIRSWLAACTAIVMLAACGGGGGGDAEPAGGGVSLETARAARATIGAAGGSVSATAADGRRYTLTVPPGALATATEISATPVTSMGDAPLAQGLRGAVRFGPAGLAFAFPATLRIEGVPTAATAGKRLVGFVRSDDGAQMQLLPTGAVNGALELPVPHFSDAGAAEASPAEVAQVPTTTPATAFEQVLTDAIRRAPLQPVPVSLADRAAALGATIDNVVVPLQAAAAASTDAKVREDGVAAFNGLAYALDLGFSADERPQVIALLNGRVERVRAAAGALLKADFDAGLARCASPAPASLVHLQGLNAAATVTVLAPAFDVSPERVGLSLQQADLGLDVDTLRRRLNDCARVVFVPQALPTFEPGRSVSLDQRAALVFAVDARREVEEGFDFLVIGTDADVANPSGSSDAVGFYTTVVTPRTTAAQFGTRACWMVLLRSGAHVPGELCGRQTVGGELTEVVLAGRLTRTHPGLGLSGSVDLRVRYTRDGTATVLLVDGSATRRGSGEVDCAGPQQRVTLSVTRENTLNQGRVLSNIGFALFGPQTTTSEELVSPGTSCATTVKVTRIDDGDLLGAAEIASITRDGAGLPLTITIGSGGTTLSGTLARE